MCLCLCVSPKVWYRAGIHLSIFAYAGGGLVAVIVGSNPAKDMGIFLLCLLCVVQVAACVTG